MFQFYGNELYANVPKIKEYFEVTNVAIERAARVCALLMEEVLFNIWRPT